MIDIKQSYKPIPMFNVIYFTHEISQPTFTVVFVSSILVYVDRSTDA